MYSGEINLVQSDEAKILLILTGGTICSFGDEAGLQRNVHIQKAQTLLLHILKSPIPSVPVRNLKRFLF